MAYLAFILAAYLLYRGYKLSLRHNAERRRLEEENRTLRLELQALQEAYQKLLQVASQSTREISPEESDEVKLARLAEMLRRKEPLL